MKSSFKSDLAKEELLQPLLNSYYKRLKHYQFERINNLSQQHRGIDVILTNKTNGKTYFLDEKAQLDYINEDLPTFAFEIQYLKDNSKRPGWLFDERKTTEFYALITSIYSDEDKKLTSCKITFVNRKLLLKLLSRKKIDLAKLLDIDLSKQGGKMELKELHPKREGYLFLSKNKAESPLNLILKLDWLIEQKVAKSFP